MNRVIIFLGLLMIVLPVIVMALVRTFLPEVGLDLMDEAEAKQTKTYTYAVYAVITMATGLFLIVVGVINLTVECHRDNVRDYCGRD